MIVDQMLCALCRFDGTGTMLKTVEPYHNLGGGNREEPKTFRPKEGGLK